MSLLSSFGKKKIDAPKVAWRMNFSRTLYFPTHIFDNSQLILHKHLN